MKKTLLASTLAAFCLTFASSCASGPNRVSYSWDQWRDQKYSESSWIHGALLQDIIPVYGLVGLFAAAGDYLIFNPVAFWSKDAWDSKGTVYVKQPVENPTRIVTDISFDSTEAGGQ